MPSVELLSKTTISASGSAARNCAITVPIAAASLKHGMATAIRGDVFRGLRFVTTVGITEESTAFLRHRLADRLASPPVNETGCALTIVVTSVAWPPGRPPRVKRIRSVLVPFGR